MEVIEKLILPLYMEGINKKTKKNYKKLPTWNHIYYDSNKLKTEAVRYKKVLIPKIQEWAWKHDWEMVEEEKVVVNITVYFGNKHIADAHNLDKLLIDCMEGILFKDDHVVLVRFQDVLFDKENPRFEIDFEKRGKHYRYEK